jgi:Family of unknown function (DUF6261)
MIKEPHFSKFVLPEFIPFVKGFAQLCKDNNAGNALAIDSFVTDTTTALNPVESAYAYQKDSPETIELDALDLRRDRAFMGIKTQALAMTYHFNAANASAGETILNCIKKYGKDVQLLALMIETETLDKLISDFENDILVKAAITTLQLTAWVAELKTANAAFNTKYLDRTKRYANQPSLPATKLKPAAVKAFEKLVKQIDSRNNIDTTGKYNTLISQLNALTEQYNTAATRRLSGGGSSKTSKVDAPKE